MVGHHCVHERGCQLAHHRKLTNQLGQSAYVENKPGQFNYGSAGMPALGAQIRAGKLRPIAVGTQQRIAALPDVPTVAEMGFKNFETSQWYGMHVPAGTPPEIIKRLQEECLKALKSSAVAERFATDNAVGGGGPSAEYSKFIAGEQVVWSDIVKRAGIKAD